MSWVALVLATARRYAVVRVNQAVSPARPRDEIASWPRLGTLNAHMQGLGAPYEPQGASLGFCLARSVTQFSIKGVHVPVVVFRQYLTSQRFLPSRLRGHALKIAWTKVLRPTYP